MKIWLVAALSVAAIGCASRQSAPIRSPSPGPVSARETKDLHAIQSAYAASNYGDVIKRTQGFERRYPKSPNLPSVQNYQGLAFLLSKRPARAIAQFSKAIEKSHDPVFRQYVLYNLASAQYETSQLDQSRESLTGIDQSLLDPENRAKVALLEAQILVKGSDPKGAATALLEAAARIPEEPQRRPLVEPLESATQALAAEEIDSLYSQYVSNPLAHVLLFRLGFKRSQIGQLARAEASLRALVNQFPDSPHFKEAEDLIRQIESQTIADPGSIGLLLPMTGRFARFGLRCLQAIALAFELYPGDGAAGHGITLVVEDSGDDPETALAALDRLFSRHHVVAVIGPLSSKGIDRLTARAQDLGLPMVTLAQQAGSRGEFVVHAGVSPRAQARELARYAIQVLKLTDFAIVHPADSFGVGYANRFWDSVEELGGRVVGIESYRPGETDFRQPIDRLSGLFYQDARNRELSTLAKEREANQITKRTRKTERYFALPPIVDFQAVFIPEEPRTAGQILPTFAYRDVEGVRYLGISAWNSRDLVARAQASAEGALFVDTFHADSGGPESLKFRDAFETAYGYAPTAFEAIAFDAAQVLRSAASQDAARSRIGIRDRILALSSIPGSTGTLSIVDGELTRPLKVLSIRGGKIAAAPRASASR